MRKIVALNNNEVLEYLNNNEEWYTHMLVHSFEDVYLEELNLEKIKISNLIEARLFGKEKELHIFEYEESEFKAIETKLNDIEEKIEEEIFLEDKFIASKEFKKIKVIRSISYDDDNQAYVSGTFIKEVF